MKTRLCFAVLVAFVLCLQFVPATAVAQLLYQDSITLQYYQSEVSATFPDLSSNQYSEIWFYDCVIRNLGQTGCGLRGTISAYSFNFWDADPDEDLQIPDYHEYATSGNYFKLNWLASNPNRAASFDLSIYVWQEE